VETTEGKKMELPGLLAADALAFHAWGGYAHEELIGGDE
jgi:hypothetical protein